MNVVKHSKFLTGDLDTSFIDENPQLFHFARSQNRAQKLLHYIGNVLVNGPQTPLATGLLPADIVPHVPPISGEKGLAARRRCPSRAADIW